MYETEELVKRIAEGIQEKKGKDIVVADLTHTDNSVCKYFVICEANTPTQVAAIAESVNDNGRIQTTGVRQQNTHLRHINQAPLGSL